MTRFFERKPMAVGADFLTLTRGIGISLIILVLAIQGIKSFDLLLALVLIGWVTDWIDGTLARKANQQSWIGKDEVTFDLIMGISAAIYILSMFSLPSYIFIYLLVWVILSLLAIYGRIRHNAMSFIWFIESGFLKKYLFVPIGVAFLTFCMGVYAIWFGSILSKIIVSVFGFAGIFMATVGLHAHRRIVEGVSSLKEDLRRATTKPK